MNRKFKHIEYSVLLDQLAQYAAAYTKLLNENGSSQQKDECKQMLHRLLAEISIRDREADTERKDPADRINR